MLVNGRVAVAQGRITGVDEAALAASANRLSAAMVQRARARTGLDFLSPPRAAQPEGKSA